MTALGDRGILLVLDSNTIMGTSVMQKSIFIFFCLLTFFCRSASADYLAAPQQYSLTNAVVGKTATIYRDGAKASVDLFLPKGPYQPKPMHQRMIVDVPMANYVSWDPTDAKTPCSTGSGDWGDPFRYWQQMLPPSKTPPKEIGKETINGIATTVYEMSGPGGAEAKLWRDDKYGLLVKFVMSARGRQVTPVNIRDFKPGKPDPTHFDIPARCHWSASGSSPSTVASANMSSKPDGGFTVQAPAAKPMQVDKDKDFPFIAHLPDMKLVSTQSDRSAMDYWMGAGEDGYRHFAPSTGNTVKVYTAPETLTKTKFIAAYTPALKGAGWKIDYTADDTIFAHYAKDGRNIYASLCRCDDVAITVAEVLPTFPLTLKAPAAKKQQVSDDQDFPFLDPLPGMKLNSTNVDASPMDFWASVDKDGNVSHVEPGGGNITKWYDAPAAVLDNFRVVNSYKPALVKAGWKISYMDTPNGSLYAHYDDNGRNIYLALNTQEQISVQVAEPPPDINLTLTSPAKMQESFGDGDNIPYLKPLAGWKLNGTQHYDGPMLVYSKDSKSSYVGSGYIRKNYVNEKDIANETFTHTYEDALKRAGWTIEQEDIDGGHFYAHYDKVGRNIWAYVDRYEHPSFTVTDVGAGLKAALAKGCKVAVYGVNFDFNKATLRPDAEPVLHQVLALFTDNPDLSVEIGGHTDDVGSAEYNQTLSEKRAAAVKDWLVRNGVAASRLSSKGYGESQPLVPNNSDANRARNRRVELKKPGCDG